jgi:hypothetical protein
MQCAPAARFYAIQQKPAGVRNLSKDRLEVLATHRLNPSRNPVPEYRPRGRGRFYRVNPIIPKNTRRQQSQERFNKTADWAVPVIFYTIGARLAQAAGRCHDQLECTPHLNSTLTHRAGSVPTLVMLCETRAFNHVKSPAFWCTRFADAPWTTFRRSRSLIATARWGRECLCLGKVAPGISFISETRTASVSNMVSIAKPLSTLSPRPCSSLLVEGGGLRKISIVIFRNGVSARLRTR